MKLLWGLIVGGLILGVGAGYYLSRSNIEPLSKQLDMKAGKANISWLYKSHNTCSGTCTNYSTSSSSSSWGGSSSFGGK